MTDVCNLILESHVLLRYPHVYCARLGNGYSIPISGVVFILLFDIVTTQG